MLSNLNLKVKFFRERLFGFWRNNEREIILAVGVLLAVLIAFGAGILAGNRRENKPPAIEEPKIEETISALRQNLETFKNEDEKQPRSDTAAAKNFVASKNGKYYYPLDCAGVKKIKEENKIYFTTKEQAEQKGLKPSPYCKW